MFVNIQSAVVDADHDLQLTRADGKTERVPRDVVQLILHVDALTVATRLTHLEHGWVSPDAQEAEPLTNWFERSNSLKTVPYPIIRATQTYESMDASGRARLEDARLYTFDKSGGFEEISEFTVLVQVATEPCCHTMVYDGKCGIVCHMTEDQFVRLLKHVYLSATTWRARVVVGVIGFQNAAEAAYSEPGDIQHLILQSDRPISSELRNFDVSKT